MQRLLRDLERNARDAVRDAHQKVLLQLSMFESAQSDDDLTNAIDTLTRDVTNVLDSLRRRLERDWTTSIKPELRNHVLNEFAEQLALRSDRVRDIERAVDSELDSFQPDLTRVFPDVTECLHSPLQNERAKQAARLAGNTAFELAKQAFSDVNTMCFAGAWLGSFVLAAMLPGVFGQMFKLIAALGFVVVAAIAFMTVQKVRQREFQTNRAALQNTARGQLQHMFDTLAAKGPEKLTAEALDLLRRLRDTISEETSDATSDAQRMERLIRRLRSEHEQFQQDLASIRDQLQLQLK
ncbi:MAG: hypothetical protein D6725_10230 [Planctomycetota bacterium]|nr:MAG: hypothetical protein D6725_10230 [Planctomycetota bacterium]